MCELGRGRDLTDIRFGKLVALEPAEKSKNGTVKWRCKCDCGNESVVFSTVLRRGPSVKSCGCVRRENVSKLHTKHGLTGSSTYNSWRSMLARVRNTKSPDYRAYGGRGIKVCERWLRFENFLADMGERPAGRSLDRINNGGNYQPENCRWSTPKEQANNRRNNRAAKDAS